VFVSQGSPKADNIELIWRRWWYTVIYRSEQL